MDDIAGSPQFPELLKSLRAGGRYVTAGATDGPKVELDLRTLYLKNLLLFVSAVYQPETFPRLIEFVTEGKIAPVSATSWHPGQVHEVQSPFQKKKPVGHCSHPQH